MILYGLQANNPLFEYLVLILNLVFFSMEMKFIISRELVMISGELGPVEVEVLLAGLLASIGYLTPQFF